MIQIEHRIEAASFGNIDVFKLSNSRGAYVELHSVGAGILSIYVPDKNGVLADVVLGYKNLSDYMCDGPCAGKTPGRYANRIAAGKLIVDGKLYQLNINCGPNSLHGGPHGFANRVWNSRIIRESVEFSYLSHDGEEFFPGEVDVRVVYTWSENNELTIEYYAKTDKPTVINLTNHTYFNLRGENAGPEVMMAHMLKLNADTYLPTDDSLVPTGQFAPVSDTPMDFRNYKKIGQDINADFEAVNYAKGYDSSWVINGSDAGLRPAAWLMDEESGRNLIVETDQPAVQVYTGNWLSDSPINKQGGKYSDYSGVAIECQGMPDAPNKPMFPSQALFPGDEYQRVIKYTFGVE